MSNMENLLMDSGSSSGDSDDEVDVPSGRSAPATAAVSAAPKPAPAAAPTAPATSSSEDQMKARLKNLYQAQNKRPASTSASSHHPSSKTSSIPEAPVNPRHGSTHPAHIQPSSRPPSQDPSVKQTIPTNDLRMNINISQPQHQQRPKQTMQSVRSQLASQPGQYNRSTHNSHTTHHTQSTHHSLSSRSHSTSQRSSHSNLHDPYSPAHLSKNQAHEQQQLGCMSSSNSRPSSSMPGSYSGSQTGGGSSHMYSTSGTRTDATLAAREQEIRRQKERFLVFTRVLIKYLEQKDPNLNRQAKAIIKDCAERNKNKEPGYQSVTASMKTRLKELVGENYWRKAEVYLNHYLDQQKNKGGAQGSSSSSSTQALKSQQLERHELQQQQQQRQHGAQLQARQRAPQHQHHEQQSHPPSLAMLQQEVSNRKSEIARGGTVTTPTTTNVAAKGAVSQQKKPTVPKGKARAGTPTSRKPATALTGPPPEKEVAPQEYIELKQLIDHAVTFDRTAAGQLMKGDKADLHVNEEQKKLLYYDIKPKPTSPRKTAPRPGWDKKNVFSARAAWARVRLPERNLAANVPSVGGGLSTLPPTSPTSKSKSVTSWTNEENAEQDSVLAMISEGCQQYLRGVLQKAVYSARQRQNLDAVRLWYQQHTAAVQGKTSALTLQLGSDVSRQVAQAAGNAVMTCKRLEEALEREIEVSASSTNMLSDETVQTSTSMGDLSLYPHLTKHFEGVEADGRRYSELYGGKHCSEPPLGRIPKKAKVEMIDLLHGSVFDDKICRHIAVTSSVSASYR